MSDFFATPWTVGPKAPLHMGFSRQEYWSGLLIPPLGDLPETGIEPLSLKSLALAGRFFTTESLGKPPHPPHITQPRKATISQTILKFFL